MYINKGWFTVHVYFCFSQKLSLLITKYIRHMPSHLTIIIKSSIKYLLWNKFWLKNCVKFWPELYVFDLCEGRTNGVPQEFLNIRCHAWLNITGQVRIPPQRKTYMDLRNITKGISLRMLLLKYMKYFCSCIISIFSALKIQMNVLFFQITKRTNNLFAFS